MSSNSNPYIKKIMEFFGLKESDEIPESKANDFKALVWKLKRAEDQRLKEEAGFKRAIPISNLLDAASTPDDSESPIEHKLFSVMSVRSMLLGRFTQQHEVGPYRLDFAFPDVKLYVEADGKQHYQDLGQIAHDHRRGEYLASLGWTALRFKGSQIYKDPHLCAEEIEKTYSLLLKRGKAPEPWEK